MPYDPFEHHLRMMSGPTPSSSSSSSSSDFQVSRALHDLELARSALELAILATPTGKRRNRLTEINLQLMIQEVELREAMVIRVNEGEG